jgi:glycopeptide antibiotics resistance protein
MRFTVGDAAAFGSRLSLVTAGDITPLANSPQRGLSRLGLVSDQVFPAVIAILFGAVVGTLFFIPLVAVSYRRRGRLTLGRTAFWAASLVYFMAIWTYTLLPIPTGDYRCAGAVLSLTPTLDDIGGAFADGSPFTDVRLLQVVFNVLLFVPLGFLLRVIGRRGIVVAALVGLGVSLLIELTQLTGAWGVFRCAYRLFDVGDLASNGLGALLGSLVALLVPARLRGVARRTDADAPRPVTRGRRLIAVLCDVLGASLASAAAGTSVQLFLEYGLRRSDLVADATIADLATAWVPVALWLTVILATGRSVGDLAVDVRYTGGPLPEPASRLLRFLGGIGGYLLLSQLLGDTSLVAGVFGLGAVVLLFTTRAGRGLPGVLTGSRLVDARSPEPAPAADAAH